MAVGKIVTGFSKPYVALYAASAGVISYTSGQKLSQGVSVSASASQADDNKFYADNVVSENESGVFTEGELAMTVKGLELSARRMVLGLPAVDATSGLVAFNDDQVIPDVGVGYIIRYMQDKVTTYVPVIYPRVAFKMPDESANTQEENIDWQTEELTAAIKRAEDTKRNWKYVGEDEETEAAAEDVIKTFFGIQ